MSLFTQPGHASAADLLIDDPRVAGAVGIETAGHPHSVRVLPDARWLDAQTRHAAVAARRSLLGWQDTYELEPARQHDPHLLDRTDGFGSEAERRAWLDATTANLLALPHDRMREIGCGDGKLLRELAPHCRSYMASDMSATALSRLRGWLAGRPGLGHAQVLRQAAHENGGAASDLVVINAFGQHFPDVDYLVRVLDSGWSQVAQGGHLALRDVRLLGLQATCIAAAALARASDDITMEALRQSIHAEWLAQSELALDPAFFHRYARSRGATVSVRPKLGQGASGPMRTRCDVLLGRPAPGQAGPPPATMLDSVASLRSWLAGPDRGSALLRAQPDARLAADVASYRLLGTAMDSMNAGEVRRLVALQVAGGRPEFRPLPHARSDAGGLDPDALVAVCAASGCSAVVLATPHARDGRFDLLVERGDGQSRCGLQPAVGDGALDDPALASHPLLLQSLRKLSQSLHNELARLLPAADMPARILPVMRRDQLVLGAPDHDGGWTFPVPP